LRPEGAPELVQELRPLDCGRVDGDSIRAGPEQLLGVVGCPHAATDRERHEERPRRALDDFPRRAPSLRGRGDVEEDDLVGALLGISRCGFHRVPGVAKGGEPRALDDPPIPDVEAGHDPNREPRQASLLRSTDNVRGPSRNALPTPAPRTAGSASSAAMSFSAATPPAAITGCPKARDARWSSGRSGPVSSPSRATAVTIKSSRPVLARRAA